ncbi:DUF5320 domain-containing protein [Pontiellaceae bacterium B1224]|nr:DUF5320 domain-containing protein [Pontiellaceae bacterium B1224]
MPNGNGTGPVGAGPMTGRGAGKCAGNATAGRQSAGGRGMGRGNRCGGRPQGYFRNHAQHAVASSDAMLLQEKIDDLNLQVASLEQQLAKLGAKKAN